MNRRRRLHGRRRRRSAFKKGGRGWDRFQTGLSFLGTVLPQADALNALVSAGRAGVAKLKGDVDTANKHLKAAAINTAAIIPGAGELLKGGKAIKNLKKLKTIKGAGEVLATQPKQLIKAAKTGTAKEVIGAGGNIAYWGGTGSQIRDDVTGGYDKATDKIKDFPKASEQKESPKITIKPGERKSKLAKRFDKGKSERKTTGLYV